MNKKTVLIILSFLIIFIISFAGMVWAENINDLQNQKNELQNHEQQN